MSFAIRNEGLTEPLDYGKLFTTTKQLVLVVELGLILSLL